MANLKEIDTLITGNPELRQKFRGSRIKAAWNIINEAPSTKNHLARKNWANKIINNYEEDLDSEYRLFCSSSTIQIDSDQASDEDIDYVVASFINEWSNN